MKKAIFIDRDGTIIAEPEDEQIDSLEKLRFVPGAISALRSLAGKGYELVMVSNQDGLGTASFPEETFWPAHNMMLDTLRGEGVEFDDILIDRSFPEDNAPTRKCRQPWSKRIDGRRGRYEASRVRLGNRRLDGDSAAHIVVRARGPHKARHVGDEDRFVSQPRRGRAIDHRHRT